MATSKTAHQHTAMSRRARLRWLHSPRVGGGNEPTFFPVRVWAQAPPLLLRLGLARTLRYGLPARQRIGQTLAYPLLWRPMHPRSFSELPTGSVIRPCPVPT